MVASVKTQHPFPIAAGAPDTAPAPALEGALFKLSAALNYEDLADGIEAFCEAVDVQHVSRWIQLGIVDFRGGNYDMLCSRPMNTPAPGAEFVDDGLRMSFIEKIQDVTRANPNLSVFPYGPFVSLFGAANQTEMLKTEYFRRVLEPERWRDNMAVCFRSEDNIDGVFWLKRGIDDPPFTEEEAGVFKRYYPWMQAAMRRVRLLADTQARNLDIAAGLFDIPVATFLLDWDLLLQQHNAAAARACAAWRLGPREARAIKIPRMKTAGVPEEIFAACRELKSKWIGFRVGHDGVLLGDLPAGAPGVYRSTLKNPAHPQLEATVTMLRPSTLRLAMPSFLVRIHETNTESILDGGTEDVRLVRLLARLTQAERALVPFVAKGMSDKEIAIALSKSVPTIKNQLRSVYEKLRVPNRARLMAAVR